MKSLSIKKDSCSVKELRSDGATRVSDQRDGAMRKSRVVSTLRLLMINHSTKDQLLPHGKLLKVFLKKRRETGAILESRDLIGALKKNPRTSTKS